MYVLGAAGTCATKLCLVLPEGPQGSIRKTKHSLVVQAAPSTYTDLYTDRKTAPGIRLPPFSYQRSAPPGLTGGPLAQALPLIRRANEARWPVIGVNQPVIGIN